MTRESAMQRGRTIGLLTLVNRRVAPLAYKTEVSARLWLMLALRVIVRTDVLLRHICSQAKPGSVIYDIGANTGLYSIVLARRIAGSLVYAFEPNATSYDLLVENIRLMGLVDRVVPMRIALDASSGRREFFVSSKPTRSSLHPSAARRDGHSIATSYEVECLSLDDLVNSGRCSPPSIIKIDTEGNEFNVVRGATQLLSCVAPTIGIEPHVLDETGDTGERVIQHLVELGYECGHLGYPIWCCRKGRE